MVIARTPITALEANHDAGGLLGEPGSFTWSNSASEQILAHWLEMTAGRWLVVTDKVRAYDLLRCWA